MDPELKAALKPYLFPSLDSFLQFDDEDEENSTVSVGNGLTFICEKINLALNPKLKGADSINTIADFAECLNPGLVVENQINT